MSQGSRASSAEQDEGRRLTRSSWITAALLHFAPHGIAATIDAGTGTLAWSTAAIFVGAVLPFVAGAVGIPAVALKLHRSSALTVESRRVPVWVVVTSCMSFVVGALPTFAVMMMNTGSLTILSVVLVGLMFHAAATRVIYRYLRSAVTAGSP